MKKTFFLLIVMLFTINYSYSQSIKQNAVPKEEIKIIEEGNGLRIKFPSNYNIISTYKDNSIGKIVRDTMKYGIQPITADAHFSRLKASEQYRSDGSGLDVTFETVSQSEEPAFRDGRNVCNKELYLFPCDLSNVPEWRTIKCRKVKRFLLTNIVPIDRNNISSADGMIRKFLTEQGEQPINLMMYVCPQHLSDESGWPTKAIIFTTHNIDSTGHDINEGSATICPLYDSDIIAPGNLSRTTLAFGWVTQRNNNADGSYSLMLDEICIGKMEVSPDGKNLTPRLPSLIVYDYDTITGVEKISEVAKEYSLMQNYPNPFNPVTKIKFAVPKTSNVSLKVFDLLGREVVTLIEEEMHPGIYQAEFNGERLASGIYLYLIKAEGYIKSAKMILMK